MKTEHSGSRFDVDSLWVNEQAVFFFTLVSEFHNSISTFKIRTIRLLRLISTSGGRFHHSGYKCDICLSFLWSLSQCLLCRGRLMSLLMLVVLQVWLWMQHSSQVEAYSWKLYFGLTPCGVSSRPLIPQESSAFRSNLLRWSTNG